MEFAFDGISSKVLRSTQNGPQTYSVTREVVRNPASQVCPRPVESEYVFEQDPRCFQHLFFVFCHITWHVGSSFPNQGSNQCPLQWKHRPLDFQGSPPAFVKAGETLVYSRGCTSNDGMGCGGEARAQRGHWRRWRWVGG